MMLEYTQSFEQFSQSVKPLDLALYAGAGLILWVLFKDKLSPVQTWIGELIAQVKNNKSVSNIVTTVDSATKKDDVFFDLIASWKQTRDLAVKSGCSEAVKVADQMFPFLSPTACVEKKS
jgi:hypothetical protein